MDQKTVYKLENKIENAIAEVMSDMGLRKLPFLPARHTMTMMAKAAVAVYEGVVEGKREHRDIQGNPNLEVIKDEGIFR